MGIENRRKTVILVKYQDLGESCSTCSRARLENQVFCFFFLAAGKRTLFKMSL